MIKRSLFALLLAAGFSAVSQNVVQSSDHYTVKMDLTEVEDDKLTVQVFPPVLNEDSVEYHIPRIIPGTYDVHNYGRLASGFKAFNSRGGELTTTRLDSNRWMIRDAKKLYKISYQVDDTYDAEEDLEIFEPAGTTIEDSVYLLNNFGFIGYVKNHKEVPFKLHIKKPAGFYGSTALRGDFSDTLDVFEIDNYFAVHDNPIMYCLPDTAIKKVGGADILVSVYSPNGTATADECMAEIAEVLDGAATYLGGELPVDKYAVLIYCVPMNRAGNRYGALEHQTSTVLYMPEFGGERFYAGVRDITAHEFFHIVTPLGIHSEQIADFNFINPEMSQHIWLYEGVTEYNSHLVQVRSEIYAIDEFVEVMRDKLVSADKFNQYVPLTQASQHTLDIFKDQYLNFYQKGAVGAMALDLKLRSLSEGNYGLINLLEELGATYGADTFFVDDDLFDIITEMTYPEMREFFALHFESSEPFPLQELLYLAGIEYKDSESVESFSIGGIDLGLNFETNRLTVEDVSEMDAFGQQLGYQAGDEIVSFDGTEVNIDNISDVVQAWFSDIEVGKKLKVVVARPQENGGYKNVKLKGKAVTVPRERLHTFNIATDITPEQASFRQKWINQ